MDVYTAKAIAGTDGKPKERRRSSLTKALSGSFTIPRGGFSKSGSKKKVSDNETAEQQLSDATATVAETMADLVAHMEIEKEASEKVMAIKAEDKAAHEEKYKLQRRVSADNMLKEMNKIKAAEAAAAATKRKKVGAAVCFVSMLLVAAYLAYCATPALFPALFSASEPEPVVEKAKRICVSKLCIQLPKELCIKGKCLRF